MTNQAFTVFTADCHQGNDHAKYVGLGLEDFVAKLAKEFPTMMHTPVAWAPEHLNWDGTRTVNEFRAESIAAGRVIVRSLSGKLVVCGVGAPKQAVEEQTPFRIGGYYRDGAGALVHLVRLTGDGDCAKAEFFDRGRWHAYGANRLCDGRYVMHTDESDNKYHLIPGELNAQGEPVEFYVAEPLKPVIDRARSPSVSIWLELKPYKLQDFVAPVEPKRPPLDWAKPTFFDPFKGYEVSRRSVPDWHPCHCGLMQGQCTCATPDHAYSHPLTRVADAGAQVSADFGSAWLVVR